VPIIYGAIPEAAKVCVFVCVFREFLFRQESYRDFLELKRKRHQRCIRDVFSFILMNLLLILERKYYVYFSFTLRIRIEIFAASPHEF